MHSLSYDLHIHSCLSPCGDIDMTPSNIIGMSALKGLDIIAITDHNSALNCPYASKLAEEYGLIFIPGVELTTEEEVHVICLFPEIRSALEFDKYVKLSLNKIENNPKIFGEQLIFDETDKLISAEPYLLINSTSISFCDSFSIVESFGGVALPAHVDKSSNSLISNLGFIPPNPEFNTVEIKNKSSIDHLKRSHPYLNECRIIHNSDAHYLGDICEPINFLHVEKNCPESVIKALKKGIDGGALT